MKVPPPQFDRTVKFYRDIVGLRQVKKHAPLVVFRFGDKRLWIDREVGLSQAEIWLELECTDVRHAETYLDAMGVVRRDDIEALPEGFSGFWIASPCDIIHLISQS